MRFLFLAFTTAQIMNAIILSHDLFTHDVCDLFYSETMGGLAPAISKSGAFQNIYLRKDDPRFPRDTPLHTLRALREYAQSFQKIRKSLPFDPSNYDRTFVSGINLWNFEHYYAMKAANPHMSLSLYEEGICEYYTLGLPIDAPRMAFSSLFFRHYYLFESDSLYVHCPEVVKNRWRNIQIKRIPPVSKGALSILNRVFGYQRPQFSGEKGQVIFLEQWCANGAEERHQRELIDLFAKSLPPEHFKIKLHPTSSADKYGEGYQVLRFRAPMEIIAMNEDISSIVFVTIDSSAAANLSMACGQYPDVIMLYHLAQSKIPPYLDDLFHRIQTLRKEGHFWIPESRQELSEILNIIIGNASLS